MSLFNILVVSVIVFLLWTLLSLIVTAARIVLFCNIPIITIWFLFDIHTPRRGWFFFITSSRIAVTTTADEFLYETCDRMERWLVSCK